MSLSIFRKEPLYSYKSNGIIEYYVDHIENMFGIWKEIKGFYLPSLTRLLGNYADLKLAQEELDRIILSMIVLHDLGKLTPFYQKGGKGVRHEILGSYEYLRSFKSIFPISLVRVASATILLHHEYILMGEVARMREPVLTVTELQGQLSINPDARRIYPDAIDMIEFIMARYIGIRDIRPQTEYELEDISKGLKEIITRTRNGRKAFSRLATSSLLIPLMICDDASATSRSTKPLRIWEKILKNEISKLRAYSLNKWGPVL